MEDRSQEGPDRGWSWVIALAACFNSLVFGGIIRISGVLFVEFIKEFGVTRKEASWPVALCFSVLNLTGLITGALGQKFGVRSVTILGSFVATIGFSCCYLTTSLKDITILFGVVFGVGYGLSCTLMPVIVNEYFLNYRAMASGIANIGSCFGSILLPPLFEFLIDKYGLSGCFILTGGIVFQTVISGSLMRPPLWLQKRNYEFSIDANSKSYIDVDSQPIKGISHRTFEYDAVIENTECKHSEDKSLAQDSISVDTYHQCLSNQKCKPYSISSTQHHGKTQSECLGTHSLRDVTDYISATNTEEKNEVLLSAEEYLLQEQIEKMEIEDVIGISINDLGDSINTLQEVFTKIPQYSIADESCEDVYGVNFGDFVTKVEANTSVKKETEQGNGIPKYSIQNYENSSSMNVVDKFNSELLDKQDFPESNPQTQSINIDADKSSNFLDSSTPNKPTVELEQNTDYSSKENDSNVPRSILKSFKQVLTCPMFYITSFTNVIFYTLFFTYVVIVVDFSLDTGVPEENTKYILFAFSISDLLGRLCLGWVTDRKFLRRSHFVMGCMSLIGLTFFTFPFATSYAWLIIINCFYGLLQGCTMVVFPILLVDYLGLELQAVSMGCLCFLNGVASLIRPFLIGYFRDNMGSYSEIFYLLGGIGIASSFLWLLENFLVRSDIKKTEIQHV